jgi:hypothetical protein
MGIEQLNQLGEIYQRSRQPIDLVDDDDINLAGADIVQQVLKIGAVSGPAGVSPVVIPGTDLGPAGVGLAFDVGRGGLILRVQRVEFLVEPMLGGETLV